MRGIDGVTLQAEPLKEWKAIVRSDNDHVFCIPTARYQVVQNAEIVKLFREMEISAMSERFSQVLFGKQVVWIDGNRVDFRVNLDPNELRRLAEKAYKNKSKKSHDGALQVEVFKLTNVSPAKTRR